MELKVLVESLTEDAKLELNRILLKDINKIQLEEDVSITNHKVSTSKFQKTYGSIQYIADSNKWEITQAAPHVCIKLKSIFEKIEKGSIAPFYFDNTPEMCADLLWFTKRYPLQITKHDQKKLEAGNTRHVNYLNDLEKIMLPDYQSTCFFELNPGKQARPYQIKGVELYDKVCRLLVGDDLGLGKTLIGIMSFLQPGSLPGVVVVQSHLQSQWADEITEFTQLKPYIINTGKPHDLPPADIYIFKYSQIGKWADVLGSGFFKSAVFDEIQELRHQGTEKYRGAQAICGCVINAMGLSATPIYNYADEIFNILNLLKPSCLGSFTDFCREWGTMRRGLVSNKLEIRDPQALGTYLRDNFLFLRRTRADVGMELQPINRIIHTVDYDEEKVQGIEDMCRMLAIKVKEGHFTERGQAARDLDMLLRQTTGVSKARYVAAYVKMLLDNGAPVVLAGWHREVYRIWAEELAVYNPVFYTGSESTKKKKEAFDKFTAGETNLFIISLRSGVGIDGLQYRGQDVVIGELDWTPKVHEQLIARVDRPGQIKQVTAHYLVSEFGSDPPIIHLLGLKASQSQSIVDPLSDPLQKVTDSSRIQLFAEKYYDKSAEVKPVEITHSFCCNAIIVDGICTECEQLLQKAV